ncbi:hypothetical protein [Nocardioides sp. CF8]|uniref:hypothetical protein n=1 Tax=Nocardioides sp. CF8 TaxID=110319 RepID=UPI0018DD790E|nr:hypothetical protein [Nocardioides sp. CF8]
MPRGHLGEVRGSDGAQRTHHRNRHFGGLGDGATLAVRVADLLWAGRHVADRVLDLQCTVSAHEVVRVDPFAVEAILHRHLKGKVTVVVTDGAKALDSVDIDADLLEPILDVVARESIEVTETGFLDRVQNIDAALASQRELLIDALALDLTM